MKRNIFIAIIAMLAIACNNNATKEQQVDMTMTKAEIVADEQISEEENIATDTSVSNFIPPKIQPTGKTLSVILALDKKIIKTADIRLELKNYDRFNAGIHQLVKKYNGYIATENQENTDYQVQTTMTIKVPVEKFEEIVNGFAGEGVKVIEKNITSEDVTGQAIDTKSRMEAKKQVRARYIELLKDAKKMSDVLQVQSEINSIQEDIEAANGKLQYLDHSASYSTIEITYYQFINGGDKVDNSFIKEIKDAFMHGFEVIGNILILFLSVWPLLIIILIAIWSIKRYRNKRIVVMKS
jgi:hypothetical protein